MNNLIAILITITASACSFIFKAPIGMADLAILYCCVATALNVMDIKKLISKGEGNVK